jgi:hypothetical protein
MASVPSLSDVEDGMLLRTANDAASDTLATPGNRGIAPPDDVRLGGVTGSCFPTLQSGCGGYKRCCALFLLSIVVVFVEFYLLKPDTAAGTALWADWEWVDALELGGVRGRATFKGDNARANPYSRLPDEWGNRLENSEVQHYTRDPLTPIPHLPFLTPSSPHYCHGTPATGMSLSSLEVGQWLQHDSAGLYIQFKTNSPDLAVDITYRDLPTGRSMWLFPPSGAAGLDLYAWDEATSNWRWTSITNQHVETEGEYHYLSIMKASPNPNPRSNPYPTSNPN